MPTYNSGFWGGSFALGTGNRTGLPFAYSRLARRTGIIRELLDTTIGAAAGSAASLTYKRVKHSQTELGGVRPIEVRTVLSRNSAAADVTALKAMVMWDSRIATPTNRAGTNWKA